MENAKIRLKLSPDDPEVGYLYLTEELDNKTVGAVSQTVSLNDLIKGYKGPSVHFDFDKENNLLGIEIVG